MEPFTTHTGIVATLDRANVDTDAIIPKQFLKSIKRTGYGPNAFFDWRYLPDGGLDMTFDLNQPRFKGRSILVTRNNFGCGSSREHAVWALEQDGYRVVIAPARTVDGKRLPGFADIFRNNTTKNGMLAIELSEAEVDAIFDMVAEHSGLTATVDLPDQHVVLHTPSPRRFVFEIDAGAKQQLLGGLDDIDLTIGYEADISRFEAQYDPLNPQR
ncbi:3-isopropylmalate dehydratase small subunit [Desulfosarcina alkanivorans]|uniref:3-isopropylmalate dehydratase small subunit n=1 Tax=Desulfosarcina alkanivorans TaxID=571177 RepID=A0A5K7YRP7_9BACT|nr:3-isopropylmalate dehydratase small subunit [Desulfosarcina alkanivorans]BBO71015.1 3-isopropylmalate dehydratase small subunit [Desulfosarcina alkanivorans]